MPAASPSRTSNGCRISDGCSGRGTRSGPGSRRRWVTRSTGSGTSRRTVGSRFGARRLSPASARWRPHWKRAGSIHDHQAMTLVRDAMVREPRVLDAFSTAQEAGLHLTRPEVRAVLVCEDGKLVGVVTRKTLVERVVAAGRDPSATRLSEIAEPPIYTLDADAPLDEAFRALEERDLERVPVTEGGRLVGVLSRSGVQRRLVEDEPAAPDDQS